MMNEPTWEQIMADTPFAELKGKTLVAIERDGNKRLTFKASDGSEYVMWHSQDCCETVEIESIVGELDSLIGSPITMADEASNKGGEPKPEYPDSWTWTFYKLATVKGYVDIRWLGESNGYYSESVDFARTVEPTATA